VWREDDSLIVDSGYGVRLRTGPQGSVIGGSAEGVSFPLAVRALLQPLLTHLLGLSGRLALHAAAIARADAAAVVLGGTGRGKSTVAYAASRAGWRLLADDLVVVRSDLTVIGVHRPPHVPADIAADQAATLAGDHRGRVAPDLSLDTDRHQATAVLIVDHDTGDSGAIAPLAPLAVAQLAFSSFPVSYPPFARAALPLAADLAALPSYELRLPADPAARLDFVASALGSLDTGPQA
jgi:hypothetical protein